MYARASGPCVGITLTQGFEVCDRWGSGGSKSVDACEKWVARSIFVRRAVQREKLVRLGTAIVIYLACPWSDFCGAFSWKLVSNSHLPMMNDAGGLDTATSFSAGCTCPTREHALRNGVPSHSLWDTLLRYWRLATFATKHHPRQVQYMPRNTATKQPVPYFHALASCRRSQMDDLHVRSAPYPAYTEIEAMPFWLSARENFICNSWGSCSMRASHCELPACWSSIISTNPEVAVCAQNCT